jgi:hypothetical protein
VGHLLAGPNPGQFPALGRDCHPSALVAKESVGAVKCPAPLQPAAHLAVVHQSADDLLAKLRLAAVEPLVVPEARRSAQAPRTVSAQQESSLEMLAQLMQPDAAAHLVQPSERQALRVLLPRARVASSQARSS